eukprot:365063-Chlamydomonas_euryale.AAC.2
MIVMRQRKWEKVSKQYGDDLDGRREFKSVILADRGAWTIAAALVLTIAIPASFASAQNFLASNAYNTPVSYVYVASLVVCATASVMCIWNATFTFVKINALPAGSTESFMIRLDTAKRHAHGFGELVIGVVVWAGIAFFSVAVLLASSVYLHHGPVHFFIAAGIELSGIILACHNERLLQRCFYEHLEPQTENEPDSVSGETIGAACQNVVHKKNRIHLHPAQ